jgi:hypothetical protein
MKPAKLNSFFLLMSVIAGISLLLYGCASEKELVDRSMGRYLSDGMYVNKLKGYQFKWPPRNIWKSRNSPEFDASFDHVDGYSQVLVLGVRGLIRKDFPDGFLEWLLDRLGAIKPRELSREKRPDDGSGVDVYRITMDCRFTVVASADWGVKRRVIFQLMRKKPYWVAVMYIAPVDSFEQYMSDAELILDSLTFISE